MARPKTSGALPQEAVADDMMKPSTRGAVVAEKHVGSARPHTAADDPTDHSASRTPDGSAWRSTPQMN